MATASARPARSRPARPAPARTGPARARPRAVGGRPVRAGAIRWDRVGKLVVRCMVVFVALLYVHPLLSIWSTRERARQHRVEVVRLSAEQQRLHDRIAALRGDKALEHEARRLGMVRRGERAYVITNLKD
jgi:cell division protein FtsB